MLYFERDGDAVNDRSSRTRHNFQALTKKVGRAIAQEVSSWLPAATAGHVGFVVDKVALGQVFSEYFGFPCQSLFHQLLHNHHCLSSGAGTIGQKWPPYQVDLVPPH
jgi:hypothetical protein